MPSRRTNQEIADRIDLAREVWMQAGGKSEHLGLKRASELIRGLDYSLYNVYSGEGYELPPEVRRIVGRGKRRKITHLRVVEDAIIDPDFERRYSTLQCFKKPIRWRKPHVGNLHNMRSLEKEGVRDSF